MDTKDIGKEIGKDLEDAQEFFDTTWKRANRLFDGMKERLTRIEEKFSDLTPGFAEAVAQFVAKPGGPVQLVKVTVSEGNVTIVGEMKSLTINGKLVRFAEGAVPGKKPEEASQT